MATTAKIAQTFRKGSARIAAPVTKPEGQKALKVVPKRAGFRRAGHAFPDGETVIPLGELTDEQYAQLTNEPMLVTFLVDIESAAEQAQA